MPSETLSALLKFAKSPSNTKTTWTSVRDIIAPLYHYDMKIDSVIHVLLTAYTEALVDPRFEMPNRDGAAEALLLSPIKGGYSVFELYAPVRLDASFTVEQFYDSFVAQMISDLRLTRVDWLKESHGDERLS